MKYLCEGKECAYIAICKHERIDATTFEDYLDDTRIYVKSEAEGEECLRDISGDL